MRSNGALNRRPGRAHSSRAFLIFVAILLLFIALIPRAEAASVTLAWDPNTEPDVAGYIVFWGTASGNYTSNQDVGNQPSYAVPGLVEGQTYYFAVKARNQAGQQSNFSGELSHTVPLGPNQLPTASPGASPTSGKAPLTVAFTGSGTDPDGTIAGYAWDFGDGGTSTQQNPSHTYSTQGTRTARLTVTDNRGGTGSSTVQITVSSPNQAPTATASRSPATGIAPLAVNFTGGGTDSDGSIASYSWNFGDATSSTAQSPSHTYNNPGTYTAVLTVRDNEGATGTASVQVTVTANQPPTASPGASPTSGKAPLIVSFTGSGTDPDGTIAGWAWDFGDGGTSTQQNPSHTYSTQGTRTARLTVTDNRGGTGSATVQITVSPPNQAPTATASRSPATGIAPLAVNFTGGGTDSDGSIASYSWNFGDATSSTSQSPSHTYNNPGVYTAVLTVRDNEGATGTASLSVTVDAASGATSGPSRLITGLGPYPSQGGRIEFYNEDFLHEFWLRIAWPEYVAASGEVRVAVGDIDGDGRSEIIVGFGPVPASPGMPGGRFAVLDSAYNHLAWGQIDWAEYNNINGETWPACGDLDGDGKEEILIGLGPGGGGKVAVFGYASGALTLKTWITVDWVDYNVASGETRPVTGDLDGDGKREIIIGLGPVGGNAAIPGGAFEVRDHAYSHLAWGHVDWPDYNAASGETWPAAGDTDGDGKEEIVVGLGGGGGGKVEVFGFASGAVSHRSWLTINWSEYASLFGETRPTTGQMDEDGRREIVVGLGKGGGGWMESFDDASTGYAPTFNIQIPLGEYNEASGETWPVFLPIVPGPVTSNLLVSPNPTAGVSTVTLTAAADNTGTGGVRIEAGEWWLDPKEGPGLPLAAADGVFDSPMETLSASIDVFPWPPGNYTLLARAKDASGNWGAPASVSVRVGPAPDTVTITGAAYSNRKRALTVAARSSAAPRTVTLTAQGFGPMTYVARKKVYRGVFKVSPRPPGVTVISSGGGSQTRNLP